MPKWMKAVGHYVVLAASAAVAYAPEIVTQVAPFFPQNKYVQIAAIVIGVLTGGSAARQIAPNTVPGCNTGTKGLLMQPEEKSEN